MKVFYTENHIQHDPPFEVYEGGIALPIFDNPLRLKAILSVLERKKWANILKPKVFGIEPILEIHDSDYVTFLQTAYKLWEDEGGELGPDYWSPVLLPASFPPRRSKNIPKSLFGRCGFYSMGTNAPIVSGTYWAAFESVQCALSAADSIANGEHVSVALCRPPGHHAGIDYCGGYCYFNNSAIAAHKLSSFFKVAILDIDFHAGNGTEDIFYKRGDIFTISLHADPSDNFPSYLGYEDETGEDAGYGYHLNYILPKGATDKIYVSKLKEALGKIKEFNATALVISAGMDICESDPVGNFNITNEGISEIGFWLAKLEIPTVICLEGGYNLETLGENFTTLVTQFN